MSKPCSPMFTDLSKDVELLNQKDRKYEDGKAYTRIGNEWFSMDALATKKEVTRLIDIVNDLVDTLRNNIGITKSQIIIKELDELKEELNK